MTAKPRQFVVWLMHLSIILRCFTIALLCHVGLLILIGMVKLVVLTKEPLPPQPDITTGPPIGGDIGCGVDQTRQSNPPEPVPPKPTASLDDVISRTPSREPNIPKVIGSPVDGPGDLGEHVRLVGNSMHGGLTGNPLNTELLRVVSLDPNSMLGGRPGLPGLPGKPGKPKPPLAPAEADQAVLRGLRWLKANQQADGSWECRQSKTAGTALAVLAFLGRGEGPDSTEFGPQVQKGLEYLVAGLDANGFVRDRNMYAQGVTTLALAEAYGITGSKLLLEPLERAVSLALKCQQTAKAKSEHVGGWRYSPTSADSDCSVSGWMVMGLKSAQLAGLKLPAESGAAASKFLWNMYDAAGGFGYAAGHRTPNMTAVGVLCQQFLGQGGDARLRKALDYLKTQKADWASANGNWVLYGWYYATQAMFQAGDKYWATWEPQIRKAFCSAQAEDGHWEPPPNSSREKDAGPAYSTALGCLVLEVYYRYLPIYRDHEVHPSHAITLTANSR